MHEERMKDIELITERTKLRLTKLSDLENIHNLHSLEESDKYNTLGIPKNIEETKAIVERWIEEGEMVEMTNFSFTIESKASDEFIGLIGLKTGTKKYRKGEVSYVLHPKFWNNGLATEVLKAIIDFGFDHLNLHRIHAGCAVDNIGSIKVLEKSGMIKEGRRRQILPLKSGWSDNFEYAILETDERK